MDIYDDVELYDKFRFRRPKVSRAVSIVDTDWPVDLLTVLF